MGGTYLEQAVPDQLEGKNGCALLCKAVAVRRHGSRGDASNICMVPSRGHKKHNLPVDEDWGHDSDVWQMRSSCQLGMVGNQNISFLQPLLGSWAPITVVSDLHEYKES